jgi:hypothetical protein
VGCSIRRRIAGMLGRPAVRNGFRFKFSPAKEKPCGNCTARLLLVEISGFELFYEHQVEYIRKLSFFLLTFS